jgi:hypothetical protein
MLMGERSVPCKFPCPVCSYGTALYELLELWFLQFQNSIVRFIVDGGSFWTVEEKKPKRMRGVDS